MDIGLQRAGFETIWANDNDKDSCDTFKAWSGVEPFLGDIAKVESSEIPDSDVITGGFPCQGFSLAGPRKIDDSRNALYHHFVRIVGDKQPDVFIAENVRGIFALAKGQILQAIVRDFGNKDYRVYYELLNAVDFNVPQERWRVFLVGIRKDIDIQFVFPEGEGKPVIGDFLTKGSHPQQEDVYDGPFSPWYTERNRRRNWDEPAFTIPAMAKQVSPHPSSPEMVKKGPDEWVFGDGKSRRFSWREAARLQTFPDMEFHGNLVSRYRQVGNAVPVNLAYAIGKSLMDAFNGVVLHTDRLF